MRNHSFLYLLRPDGEEGELQCVAESNSVFPSLWRILLADARVASQGVRRVLRGTAEHVLEAQADQALRRYETFVSFMSHHARRAEISGLQCYLEGAARHLRELVAEWTEAGTPPPVLCADFDELAQPANQHVAAFMHEHLERSRQLWQEIESLAPQIDATWIEQLFGFRSSNLRFTDWRAWSGLFGLALFQHPYFARAFRKPFDCAYEDYAYDELGSEAHLGDGMYRFKEQDHWGVRAHAPSQEPPVLQAVWDRVLRAGPAETHVVWVKRGDRFGLAAIRGERAGELRVDPVLDEVAPFEHGIAPVRLGSRMGFLRSDGSWHLAPAWDRVWPFQHECALVDLDQRLGYIDMQGAFIVEPQFDEAGHFTAAGVARVGKAKRFGLLRSTGELALAIVYSCIEWSEAFHGWRCVRDGGCTLVQPDGSAWVDEPCEQIDVCVPQRLIRVRRAGRYGLLDWEGRALLGNEYERLEPLAMRDDAAVALIARRSRREGVIDECGNQLVPFEFSRIEPLDTSAETDCDTATPQLLRVYSLPQRGRPEVGIRELRRGVPRADPDHRC